MGTRVPRVAESSACPARPAVKSARDWMPSQPQHNVSLSYAGLIFDDQPNGKLLPLTTCTGASAGTPGPSGKACCCWCACGAGKEPGGASGCAGTAHQGGLARVDPVGGVGGLGDARYRSRKAKETKRDVCDQHSGMVAWQQQT
jgi:hypothetical protein